MASLEPGRDDLAWLLEATTSAAVTPLGDLRGLRGWDRLDAAARASGHRLVRWSATIAAAAAQATPGCPVVGLVADGSWLLIVGVTRRGVRVRREQTDPRLVVVTIERLAAELGASSGEPIVWGLVEVARAFDPHADDHPESHATPWERLGRLISIERRDIAIIIAYALFAGGVALTVPVAVQALVNTVVFGTMVTPIVWLSVLVLGGLVFAAVLQLAQVWVVETMQRRVLVNLAADLAFRLPRVRLDVSDRAHLPLLVNRFFDVIDVQKALAVLLLDGVGVAVSSIAGTMLLAFYHPYFLAYIVLLWAGLAAMLVALGWSGPRTAIAESYRKHDLAAWIEIVAGQHTAFKGGGASDWAATRTDALSHAWLDARSAHFRVWFGQVGGLLLLYAVASAGLLALGGALVVAGKITVGQLMAAELVIGAVLGGFAKLGKQLEKLYDLLAALDKIGHLLELPLEREGGEKLPTSGAALLTASHLAYHFPDDEPLLRDVTFELRPGERIALSGEAGSGKRTLLDLLAGARSPRSGWVKIDGVDVRDLDLEDLRAHVAVVRPGEVLPASILENVTLGRDFVTEAEARRAIDEVGLADLVSALPEGLDTELTPAGHPLGRTATRLLILARALAGQPRVLLVDELLDVLPPRHRAVAADAILRRTQLTALVVTRDPALQLRFDRVINLAEAA